MFISVKKLFYIFIGMPNVTLDDVAFDIICLEKIFFFMKKNLCYIFEIVIAHFELCNAFTLYFMKCWLYNAKHCFIVMHFIFLTVFTYKNFEFGMVYNLLLNVYATVRNSSAFYGKIYCPVYIMETMCLFYEFIFSFNLSTHTHII